MIIEQEIIQFLSDRIGYPVCAQRPESDHGNQYVLVQKTGSTCKNKLTTSTIAIQSCAPRLIDAARINEDVKAAMDKLARTVDVSAVYLTTDYNFTNTASKKYRYQAVYQITHY